MDGTGPDNIIAILQAGGTPVLGLVGYFLWRLSNQMRDLKISLDVFVDLMTKYDIQPRRKSGD